MLNHPCKIYFRIRQLFFTVFLQISHMFSALMSFVVWRKRGIFQTEEPARLLHTSGARSEGKPWAMENAISLSHCPWGWMVGAEEGKMGQRGDRGSERDWSHTMKAAVKSALWAIGALVMRTGSFFSVYCGFYLLPIFLIALQRRTNSWRSSSNCLNLLSHLLWTHQIVAGWNERERQSHGCYHVRYTLTQAAAECRSYFTLLFSRLGCLAKHSNPSLSVVTAFRGRLKDARNDLRRDKEFRVGGGTGTKHVKAGKWTMQGFYGQ